MRVARVPRRHDAIEHIDSAPHRLDDIFRTTDPHQITRLVRRHVRYQSIEDLAAFRLALAHRETADGKSRKADVLERLERCRAQISVNAPLYDAEQRPGRLAVVVFAK